MNAAIQKIQRLDRQLRSTTRAAERSRPQWKRSEAPVVPAGVASFRTYVERVNPWALQFEHVPRLVEVLQKVADTHDPACVVDGVRGGPEWRPLPGNPNWKRVAVIMPPRYLKSELCSRLFPAYLLRRFGAFKVGLSSYGADLAWDLSEEARSYFEAGGGVLSEMTSAKKNWKSTDGGQMWARGVGGGTIGLGFNQGVIDDPQDPDHAHSTNYQARFRRWFPSKFLSREEPGAGILLVMQRLGEEDAFAYLMEREAESPQHWHVVCLDEIKSAEPLGDWGKGDASRMGLPESCTLEEDPREVGEALAPTRFSLAEALRKQADAGDEVGPTQRQQRAATLTGDVWHEVWFEPYDELPEDATDGGTDWDTAYTAKEANAASAFCRSFRGRPLPGPDGKLDPHNFYIYIEDVGWDWLEAPELEYWLGGRKPDSEKAKDLKPIPGPHFVEDKASGKSLAQNLKRLNIPVTLVPVPSDKYTRTAKATPVAAARRVKVQRRVYKRLLRGARQGLLRVRREHLIEGTGWLDLNDAVVQAILRHSKPTIDHGRV